MGGARCGQVEGAMTRRAAIQQSKRCALAAANGDGSSLMVVYRCNSRVIAQISRCMLFNAHARRPQPCEAVVSDPDVSPVYLQAEQSDQRISVSKITVCRTASRRWLMLGWTLHGSTVHEFAGINEQMDSRRAAGGGRSGSAGATSLSREKRECSLKSLTVVLADSRCSLGRIVVGALVVGLECAVNKDRLAILTELSTRCRLPKHQYQHRD